MMRRTSTDVSPQVEAGWLRPDQPYGHLKGCLIEFCRAFLLVHELPGPLRPSYFPFTEPSAEVDIGCSRKAVN